MAKFLTDKIGVTIISHHFALDIGNFMELWYSIGGLISFGSPFVFLS